MKRILARPSFLPHTKRRGKLQQESRVISCLSSLASLLTLLALLAPLSGCGGDDGDGGGSTIEITPEAARVRDANLKLRERICRVEAACDPANFAKTTLGRNGVEECVKAVTGSYPLFDPGLAGEFAKAGCNDMQTPVTAVAGIVEPYERCVDQFLSLPAETFCSHITGPFESAGVVAQLFDVSEVAQLTECQKAKNLIQMPAGSPPACLGGAHSIFAIRKRW